MTRAEKAQFDIQLAPKELKEETIDRQNAEQMRALQGMGLAPRRMTPRPKAKPSE